MDQRWRENSFISRKEKVVAKVRPSAFFFVINIVFLSMLSACLLSQYNPEASAIETVKKLSAEIDRYVKDHKDANRKFIARKFPLDLSSKEDSWEWKEVKSWDKSYAYFKDYWSALSAIVWIRNSRIIYVRSTEGTDSGDWGFNLEYYFDDQGRILQIAADYRRFIGDDIIKVLDFQYFNDSGQVLDHTVEYHAINWGEDGKRSEKKLSEKPEEMQTPIFDIPDIPVYLKVSDLPFYSLLKIGHPEEKK
jgi:hypothetical protein